MRTNVHFTLTRFSVTAADVAHRSSGPNRPLSQEANSSSVVRYLGGWIKVKRLIVVYFDGRKGNHNLGGAWCRACVHDVCVESMFRRNMGQARCLSSTVPLYCPKKCSSSHCGSRCNYVDNFGPKGQTKSTGYVTRMVHICKQNGCFAKHNCDNFNPKYTRTPLSRRQNEGASASAVLLMTRL